MNDMDRNTANGRDVPCGVIQDLLVLYEDDVCSKESSDIIREHIEDCDTCRKAYEQVSAPFPQITPGQEQKMYPDDLFIQAVRKFGRQLTARHVMALGVVLLIIAFVHYILTEHPMLAVRSVPSEDIQITELYQLAGGDIYCTMEFPKPIFQPVLQSMSVPEAEYRKDSSNGFYELHFQYPIFMNKEKYFYDDTLSFILPAECVYEYNNSDNPTETYTHTCKTLYYRGKNRNDRLEIWKRGQPIEEAPPHIEQKAVLAYQTGGFIEKAIKELKETGKEPSTDEIVEYFSANHVFWNDMNSPLIVNE